MNELSQDMEETNLQNEEYQQHNSLYNDTFFLIKGMIGISLNVQQPSLEEQQRAQLPNLKQMLDQFSRVMKNEKQSQKFIVKMKKLHAQFLGREGEQQLKLKHLYFDFKSHLQALHEAPPLQSLGTTFSQPKQGLSAVFEDTLPSPLQTPNDMAPLEPPAHPTLKQTLESLSKDGGSSRQTPALHEQKAAYVSGQHAKTNMSSALSSSRYNLPYGTQQEARRPQAYLLPQHRQLSAQKEAAPLASFDRREGSLHKVLVPVGVRNAAGQLSMPTALDE